MSQKLVIQVIFKGDKTMHPKIKARRQKQAYIRMADELVTMTGAEIRMLASKVRHGTYLEGLFNKEHLPVIEALAEEMADYPNDYIYENAHEDIRELLECIECDRAHFDMLVF